MKAKEKKEKAVYNKARVRRDPLEIIPSERNKLDMKDRKAPKKKITEERVKTIVDNMVEGLEELREETGLTLPIIQLIQEAEEAGLRGPRANKGGHW